MRTHLRNGLLIKLFCVCTIFSVGCASQEASVPGRNVEVEVGNEASKQQADEQAKAGEDIESGKHLWYEAGKEDLSKWPRRLIDDSKDSFLRLDNATALLLAGGASVILHNSDGDRKAARHFDKHSSLQGFEDEALHVLGHPLAHAGATSLWYFLSAQNEDDLNRQRAWTMRTALTINWVATTGLQFARDRDSPNDKDRSWPSSHVSSSFTVASVLDEFYGPKIGIPAYIAASAVAYRAMDTGDNWASDVVFGAALGWVVGHTVAGKHKDLEIAGFDIVPYISQTEKPAVGIGFLKRF